MFPNPAKNQTGTPLAVSVTEAVRLTGIGRSKLYSEISAGRLVPVKVGRRTVIRLAELHRWLDVQAGSSRENPGSVARAGGAR